MLKYFLHILLILFSCETVIASTVDTTKPIRSAIEVHVSTPFFGESFYRIFHVDPFEVYQSQYQFDSSIQINLDTTGNNTAAVTGIWSATRNKFFVFHRDSSYGYSYDLNSSIENNRRLPVDSTLQGIKGKDNFENLLTKKTDTTTWNAQRTELKEVYVQKASKDTPSVHLSIFYSSNLNSLNASLNSALDSARKMKFYKYEYVIQEFYSEKEQRLWPAMKIRTEMKEFTVTNPEEIIQYIDRYKISIAVKKHAGNKFSSYNP
jgi:hypothetical protein